MSECGCFTVVCEECSSTLRAQSPVLVADELKESYTAFMEDFYSASIQQEAFHEYLLKVGSKHGERIVRLFDRGIVSKHQWIKLCETSESIREIVLRNLEKKYRVL